MPVGCQLTAIKAINENLAIPDAILAGTAIDCADDEYQPGADMDGSADEDQLVLKVVAAPKAKPLKKTKITLREQVEKIANPEDSEDQMEVRKGKRKAQSNTSMADDQL